MKPSYSYSHELERLLLPKHAPSMNDDSMLDDSMLDDSMYDGSMYSLCSIGTILSGLPSSIKVHCVTQ